MSGIRLELANPEGVKDYVEKHLAPVATELHRIVNELLSPGATSDEEWRVDSVPAPGIKGRYTRLVRPLFEWAKHLTFDGSEYFSIPKELLRSKQVKVQFTAVVYSSGGGPVSFRLVDQQGEPIESSDLFTTSEVPVTLSTIVPFGESRGCVHPSKLTYFIEGRTDGFSKPVCRRFSLSFVYI